MATLYGGVLSIQFCGEECCGGRGRGTVVVDEQWAGRPGRTAKGKQGVAGLSRFLALIWPCDGSERSSLIGRIRSILMSKIHGFTE